ncbi:hypothetical protein QTN25_009819 [Entamoeba marina]
MQRDECVICMDRLTVFAIGQCGHDCTCYNCSFRSRVLYGDKNVLDVYKYLKYLLSATCKFCSEEFKSSSELNEHYKVNHHVSFCPISCEFCSINFYDLDALYNHLNNEHETCFICDKHSDQPGVEYYRDYDELYAHMKRQHYCCDNIDCLTKRYVAFYTESELNNHLILETGTYFEQIPQDRPYNRRQRRYDERDVRNNEDDYVPQEIQEPKKETFSKRDFPKLGGGVVNNNSQPKRKPQQQQYRQHQQRQVDLFPAIGTGGKKQQKSIEKKEMKEAYDMAYHKSKTSTINKGDTQELHKYIEEYLGSKAESYFSQNELYRTGQETAALFLDRFHQFFKDCKDEKEILRKTIDTWPHAKQKQHLIQEDNKRNEELTKIKMRDQMFMTAQNWEEEQQKRINSKINQQIIPQRDKARVVNNEQRKKQHKTTPLFPSLTGGRNRPLPQSQTAKNWSQIAKATSEETLRNKQNKKEKKLSDVDFPTLGSKK